jgi:ABC-type multidrug transport system fused ATPase/permease subunit
MISNIIKLFLSINRARKKEITLILILMLISSLFEIVSIGSALPFLSILNDPDKIQELKYVKLAYTYFNISSTELALLVFTLCFGLLAIISSLLRLLLLKLNLNFSYAVSADLSYSILNRVLHQPYHLHLKQNSSQIIDGIMNKATLVSDGILIPVINILNALVLSVFVVCFLIIIAPGTTLSSLAGFSIIYLLVVKFTHKYIRSASKNISIESPRVIKILQEGLGGIRDLIINGNQDFYCKSFEKSNKILRTAYSSSNFISGFPRIAIEGLGIFFIALVAYFLVVENPEDNGAAIPILGLMAITIQRMLPIMQQTFSSWVSLQRNRFSLEELVALMGGTPIQVNEHTLISPIKFEHAIELKNINFSYDGSKNLLTNINCRIYKNTIFGIVGKTGSGKSTLVDIIMGLLYPSSGQINIDDVPLNSQQKKAWQSHIAHVPQNIFLADSSIAQNIALGFDNDDIDWVLLNRAIEIAQLTRYIEALPSGLFTNVGERGVRLSGGERQRIGLARAIYRNVDVLVLDEATSALDPKTESAIIGNLVTQLQNITIIMIAHRHSTLKNCNCIVEIVDGSINNIGSYDEFVKVINNKYL